MEKIEILHKDANIIVIYKPEGLLSVGFAGSRARNAQDILENLLRKRGEYSAKYKPLAVHRLDRETSGVMMFATNERAQKVIMDSWHQMVKSRKYIALAENPTNFSRFGILPDCGLIDDKIFYNAYNVGYVKNQFEDLKNESKNDFKKNSRFKNKNQFNFEKSAKSEKYEKFENKKNGERDDGISARTHFKIVQRKKHFSIFELELDTGRKNQIRAHLAGKGYPISGDKNYRAKTNPFDRLCLHAETLVYTDPWSKEEMRFEYRAPSEWYDAD